MSGSWIRSVLKRIGSPAIGYYTRIDVINVKIKRDQVACVKKALSGKLRETAEFQYILDHLRVLKNRRLRWSGGSIGKWYRTDELAEWLRQRVEGGFVAQWGQEGNGDNWAYEFDGRGGVTMCSGRRAAAVKGIRLRRGQQI